jgi:hypothetical protein
MDIYLVKTLGGALKPIDGTGEEIIDTLGAGEVIRATIKKDRNPGHHRKFFGLLGLVYKNQERYLSQEALRFAVMVSAGYVDTIALEGDKVTFRPVSISWARMSQDEFELFYNAALAAIPRLLPQFAGVDLDRELLNAEI